MLAVFERFTNVHDNLFERLNQPQRNWFFTAMIAQRTAEYKLNQIARHRYSVRTPDRLYSGNSDRDTPTRIRPTHCR